MHQMPPAPYVINLIGLALLGMGMIVDVVQHGIDFIISEFQHAPLAHGLPLAGIVLVIIGTVGGLRTR